VSYAIAYICLGVNLTDDGSREPFWNALPEEICLSDLEDDGLLEGRYSGSGECPRFVGVELASFDECTDNIQVIRDAVNAVPTREQWAAARDKIAALPKELRGLLPSWDPEVFIVWGTS